MSLPRIGVTLPQVSPYAGPEAVVTVAQAAERLGYHAVAASDRLLIPAGPHWNNDAGLPEDHVWESLELLAWAAAHTRRIRVVTGILNTIFQPPVVLARRLATLDRLCQGRLVVGIGQGGGTRLPPFYIPEEFTAAGVPAGRRGAGFVEHTAAMRACWAPDPVEFEGEHYRIPPSKIGPKPWRGSIPLLFGAIARPTIERAARLGDGFITTAVDWDDTRTQVGWYRDAGGTGTVVVNIIPTTPGEPVSPAAFTGAVLAQLDRAVAVGADETHIALHLLPMGAAEQAELIEALAAKLGLPAEGAGDAA
ncbi:LLM class flavin-dependent oxidoreductase [Nonomuraea gerenzanensis]|uniref:Luciferase-like protein n=1 Tax=Nonomuraea gerenzanensis TaxID=93944 RepID=A0A1M4EB00_9ACTN|nr:LLM class flavin-dependent oxidoreductase [Nonomuraea gerenzanensis]UBU18163.1 LLM class flavin-dependent oxidoreductase [Nonomuraea gerenzanensis]SBO95974.1 luciferase-like protein [Nonomuraea gerenzanensis]